MMKYLRVCSDLHLEAFFGQDSQTLALGFLPRDERDAESILVLAGDISSHGEQLVGFLGVCATRFAKVIYVPGNHEWYRHDYVTYTAELRAAIKALPYSNIEFALDEVGYHELEDPKVRFIFGVMWGDGGPTLADQGQVGFYLNDFRLITNGRTPMGTAVLRFTVQDMMEIHKQQKVEIDRLLKVPFDGKSVVITHHLPSRRLVSARFWPRNGSDGANGGFVGQCDDILAYDHAPNLWIHGHTHDTIDTELWKTRIVCNPAGYRGEWVSNVNTFMKANDKGVREVVPKFINLEEI